MSRANEKVFLALGGNQGAVLHTFKLALKALSSLEMTQLLSVSRLYLTSPVSPYPQSYFLNAACLIQTQLSPLALMQQIEYVESSLGKIPKAKEAPRPLDIDMLFYGDLSLCDPRLILPHPLWESRPFVLHPLSDLVETIFDPVSCRLRYLSEMIASLKQTSSQVVFPVEEQLVF